MALAYSDQLRMLYLVFSQNDVPLSERLRLYDLYQDMTERLMDKAPTGTGITVRAARV
jgi:hypothetical protein